MLITPDQFGDDTVIESFEGLAPSADAVQSDGYLDLGSATGSFHFTTGVSVIALNATTADLDPMVGDFALGAATYFTTSGHEIASEADVLFGGAYAATNGEATTLIFEFDATAVQAGAYVTSGAAVTVEAFGAGGELLASAVLEPVSVADWASGFVGFGDVGQIKRLVFTGDYLALDGLVFTAQPGGASSVPTLANPIADLVVLEDEAFSFTFAANTFNDADGDSLGYAATLAGGDALPSWLAFDPATRTFSGFPQDGDPDLVIVLTATDNDGQSVTDTFALSLADNPGEIWEGTSKADLHTGTIRQDVLDGGAGHDVLDGGAAADWITGGKGNDTLTGGSGRDAFVIGRQHGQDAITDFELGVDRLHLTEDVGVKSIKLFDADGDGSLESTRVQFTDGGSVTLLNLVGISMADDLLTPDWMG